MLTFKRKLILTQAQASRLDGWRGVSAIYKITNLINGKLYIGQTQDFYYRFYQHRKNKTKKTAIANAFRKYGFENFEIEILEHHLSLDNLNEREEFWIEKTCSYLSGIGYNMLRYANTTRGYLHKDETKAKIAKTKADRDSQRGENNPFYGRKHTQETLDKIAKANSRPQPEYRKKQVSEYNQSHIADFEKRVVQIDLKTGLDIKIWDSALKASDGLGMKSATNISGCCTKKPYTQPNRSGIYVKKSAGGYGWRFADQNAAKNILDRGTAIINQRKAIA